MVQMTPLNERMWGSAGRGGRRSTSGWDMDDTARQYV